MKVKTCSTLYTTFDTEVPVFLNTNHHLVNIETGSSRPEWEHYLNRIHNTN